MRFIEESTKLGYSHINPSFVESIGEIWEDNSGDKQLVQFPVSMFSGRKLIAQSSDKNEVEEYRMKLIDKLHMELI